MWETYRGLFDVWDLRPSISPTVAIVLGAIMVVLLLYCVYTDLRSMLIYDWVTYPGILLSALLAPLLWEQSTAHLAAGIVGGLFFMGLAQVKVRGQFALGYGDVKLYTWLGFVFAQALLPIMLLASIIGLAAQAIVLLVTKGDRGAHFPHGPHIILASFIVAVVCLVVS